MSKGLQDYQNTVNAYTGSQDAISNYVQNYDSSFFLNWKQKVDLKARELDEAQKLANGVGQAYLGGKALSYSIKSYKKKFFNNDDDTPGDEDGIDDVGLDPKGGDGSATGNVDDVDIGETSISGDGGDIANMGSGSSTDIGGERGYELQDVNTNSRPLQTENDGEAVETSFSDQTGAEPSGSATLQQGELSETPTQQQIMDADPEEPTPALLGADEDVGSASETLSSTLGDTAGETAGEIGAGVGEAGAGIGEATLGALSVGAEALGPVGLAVGIGIGLYELFSTPSAPPPPPPVVTASTRGEMVLPSYDSVTDTPASNSAF